MLDQRFAGMKQALQNATDEDRQRHQRDARDLNDLLEKHPMGEDTDAGFQNFMAKHGDFFPENPQNVDELIDSARQRAAAAQRMLNSMTAEQRAELMRCRSRPSGRRADGALQRLDANLQMPARARTGAARSASGDEGLGLGEGTGVLPGSRRARRAQPSNSRRATRAPRWRISTSTHAGASARRGGRGRRAHPARSGAAAARERITSSASDGSLRLSPKAMRQLGKTAAEGRRPPPVRAAGPAGLRRAGAAGRADRADPAVGSSGTPNRGMSRGR
jgi:uncharacterized protein with von Willebrand factor type A (vWA) domain